MVGLMEQANKPDPFVEAQKQRNMNFLSEIRSPTFDVSKSADLAPYVSMNNFGEAAARREQERQGTGLLQMGVAGSQPGLAALIAQNRSDRRADQQGGNLERAFAARYGEATGSVLPLAAFDQSRTMGLAGLGSNMSQNSTSAYTSFTPRPSFLSQLALAGISGAAGVAGAWLGKK